MSNETLTKDPLDHAEGLSGQARHRQLELGHKALRLQEKQASIDSRSVAASPLQVSKHFGLGVERVINMVAQKANKESRVYHYKTHEGAYQEQAVKDASAEGVHTDFDK